MSDDDTCADRPTEPHQLEHVSNASVPRPRSLFGVHPRQDALAAVPEDDLPEDIDAILPAQRRMSSDELVAIGRLCAAHVHGRVGERNRAELERLTALVDRFLAMPRGGDRVRPCWDLGTAARRDAEHARGPLKIAALAAYAASESGVDASRLVGDAARLAVKTLANDRDACIAARAVHEVSPSKARCAVETCAAKSR